MRSGASQYEMVHMHSTPRSNLCCKELYTIVLRKLNQSEQLPENDEMDQGKIRELLKTLDSAQWKDVLQDFMMEGSFYMGERGFQEEEHETELRSFLDILFFACVEDDLDEHLKLLIEWLQKFKEKHDYLDLDKFYHNNVAMARACKKRDVGTVLTLYEAGFRFKTELEDHDVFELLVDEDQLMFEISFLEVRASTAYLLAEIQCAEGTQDSISKVMQLIHICDRLAQTRRGSIRKVDHVKKSLEKFLIKMLDLCHPNQDEEKCEITLFLSQGCYIHNVLKTA